MMSRPTLKCHWRQHDRENLQLLHAGTLIFQLGLGVEGGLIRHGSAVHTKLDQSELMTDVVVIKICVVWALLCRLVLSVVPTGRAPGRQRLSAHMET